MNDRNRRGKWAGRKQIAVYGKGGIGKSTISANISAAMALAGCSVMQIGCDPKHDSTRLLLGGQRTATVLDYLRATEPGERSLAAIVHTGFAGVACVEAGGPEPGVGCAGRGILSALDLLESLGIGTRGHDVVLYDVLGDVVCGGFAVPLRERYADFIYIVTSGEFMSLYAANNILRGVRNFEEGGLRMAGLILNRRGLADEDERVRRFAEAVRLPLVAAFPRSQAITAAEQLGKTVVQAFPEGDEAAQFRELAQAMLRFATPLPAHPLDPDAIESIVLNKKACRVFLKPTPSRPPMAGAGETPACPPPLPETPAVQARRYRSKSVNRHEVLHGCAFNGAVHTLLQLSDAVVIAHGPRSCAYISGHGMAAAVRRAAHRYGEGCEGRLCGAVRSTEMDERVAIFGGSDVLEKQLRAVARHAPKAVFVVTTCAAGIIGDDLQVAVEAARDALPADVPVIPVTTDGDINGDYMQGVIDAMIAVADHYIDRSVSPEADMVNIVGEKNLATNTDINHQRIRSLLNALGLKLNCRFIRNGSTEQVTGFLRGRVNLLAAADLCGRTIRDYLRDHYGAAFLPSSFPVGFTATAQWLRELAAFFGKEQAAEALIARERERYEATLNRYRPSLKGKRIFIVTQSYQIDWVLDLAFDLGMEIVKVGVLSSVWDEDFVTRYQGRFPLALSYTREERDKEVRSLRPDLTLINAMWRSQPDDLRVDAIHILPDAGFESALELAQHWQRLMKLPPKEGWRDDL